MAAKKTAPAFPKTLGGCADELWRLRQERLELQKQVDLIASRESALREHIIQTLPKSDATGVAGALCRVAVVTKVVPQVNDWPALYAYIKKNSAFELLHRRVTDTAIRERWEDGKVVPGVTAIQVPTVSLNAL